MADTTYGLNHPLAVKAWSKGLEHEVVGQMYVSRFMGNSQNSIIQMKDELTKGPGDRVRVGLRVLLTGSGVQGSDTLEGNEEALSEYTDNVFIDQLRHAARSNGRIDEQRVSHNVRDECRMGLADWWSERHETGILNQLAGNTGQTDTRYTGNNSAVAPSTGSATRLILGGDETAETSLSATTTHAVKLKELDDCVAIARSQSPRIRPVKVDGKEMYVVLLHEYGIRQMRTDASTTGNFFDVQKAILQGGKISDNPIVNGASFIYNQCIVHSSSYLPATVGASDNTLYKRGVFLGAQAAIVAYGRGHGPNRYEWVEEKFDYKNKLGVAAGCIFGVKKAVFNSNDFGVITLAGYAPAP